jgi:hypothetical protein
MTKNGHLTCSFLTYDYHKNKNNKQNEQNVGCEVYKAVIMVMLFWVFTPRR